MATATPAPPREERPPAKLITAALLSAAVFIDRFVWLEPAEGGKPQRFRLWDFQRDVLEDFEEQSRLIILKARQLGLTWLALAYALWLCVANSGQTVLIYNRGLEEAKDLLRRVKFMHERLPVELQQPVVKDDSREYRFANGSRLISLPGTEDAGSSVTAQLVIMDEWAKIARATGMLNAALGTLSAGGTFIGVSTAKGYTNLFARIWKKAARKLAAGWRPSPTDSEYWPVFIPSSAHPDRDEPWRTRKRKEYDTDRDYLQEHPEEWKDAFQLGGDAVFEEFDRTRHHRNAPREPQWPTWRGVDFGWHRCPVYWIEVQGDRTAYVHTELDNQRMNTHELAAAIVAEDKALGVTTGDVKAGVDPAGTAVNVQTSEADVAVLQQHGIPTVESKVAPKDRVTLIKHLLKEDRLVIDTERCPVLADALEQAEWDTTGQSDAAVLKETYRKDGENDHPLDALGYALINIFPAEAKPAAAGAQTSVPSGDTYSQSEFG